jgi:hypothetical protein
MMAACGKMPATRCPNPTGPSWGITNVAMVRGSRAGVEAPPPGLTKPPHDGDPSDGSYRCCIIYCGSVLRLLCCVVKQGLF